MLRNRRFGKCGVDDFMNNNRNRNRLRELEEDEIKLQALRDNLRAGEDSPLVDNFNGAEFIKGLHKKYPE